MQFLILCITGILRYFMKVGNEHPVPSFVGKDLHTKTKISGMFVNIIFLIRVNV
jgi:hypothetical protein